MPTPAMSEQKDIPPKTLRLKNLKIPSFDMKTLYLLEACPESFKSNHNIIISLTPEVSYRLYQQSIPFSIPEDFLSPNELFSNVAEYSPLWFEWLDSLDNELLRHFDKLNYLGVKPAFLYGYYLQFVTDPFVVRALKLKAIFDRLKPASVKFYSNTEQEHPIDYQLYLKGCSVTSLLLSLFSKKYGFLYDHEKVSDQHASKRPNAIPSILLRFFKKIVRNFIYDIRNLPRRFMKRESVLLLRCSSRFVDLEHRARASGYRILYKLRKTEERGNFCEHKKDIDIDFGLEKLTNFSGIDFSSLIEDRLEYFVKVICPTLEREIVNYIEIIKKEKIRFVIIPAKTNFSDFAIMAAASVSPKCLAVQFFHGYTTFALKIWKFTEQPCNLWLTDSMEIANYFKEEIFTNKTVLVEETPIFTKKYDALKQRHLANRKVSSKPVVLYIPTLYRSDHIRLDAAGDYSDTWYFRYHTELLKYFSSEKEFDFIWKGFPTGGSVAEPISGIIKEQGIHNVTFTDGKLVKCILQSDFTIHDYPSTPLYEATLIGVPTICLYHDSLQIRNSAIEFWGQITKPFSTTEQAIEMIRSFLRDDPKKYLKDIPINDNNLFEILERYAKTDSFNNLN